MQHLATSPASAPTAVPVVLRDIEDLHDADLDLVLADRLTESADALRAVAAATELAVQVAAPAALRAHSLGAVARRLVG
ncbi:hypothetical protein [Blastococcus saxobsidens]|uniref:Uncharacterized protein n=1 Tax=Blastococcus saxobsidens (strain DD2) TaxID=1146883 RepID=H6RR55_BLASD|nr:hypothetical protein [Blastococcus saxobsidens]CCG04135.1 conserved protein of unknown function [Blastococcus saxobsidens DD2]